MDLTDFLEEVTTILDVKITPQDIQEEILIRIDDTKELTSSRSYLGEHIGNQAIADRIIQEIVIKEIENPYILEQMPLVEPEVDLGKIGNTRFELQDTGDEVKIVKQVYRLVFFESDGKLVASWQDESTLDIAEDNFNDFRRVVITHPKFG